MPYGRVRRPNVPTTPAAALMPSIRSTTRTPFAGPTDIPASSVSVGGSVVRGLVPWVGATPPAGGGAVGLVPCVGFIVLIVFYATEGQRGDNQYGPDPKAGYTV